MLLCQELCLASTACTPPATFTSSSLQKCITQGASERLDLQRAGLLLQVVAGKIQQITVRDFLPLLGISEAALRSYKPTSDKADMSVEFMIAYRMGAYLQL